MSGVSAGSSSLRLPAVVAWPLLVAGLLAAVWMAYPPRRVGRQAGVGHVVSTGPRIEEVRKIAKLAVLRVQVADVIEGNTAGAKAAVLVKGDADIAQKRCQEPFAGTARRVLRTKGS